MGILHIVLVEPQIPQNTGNIARTCAVTGAHLHLVKPMGFEVTDRQLKRAGLDYWHLLHVTYYEGLADFFSRTCGNYFYFTSKGRHRHCDPLYPKDQNCYLVFGREDAGLPEELLRAHPDTCVRMPMLAGARCLNLSNSVAVGAYEVLRQWDFPGLCEEGQLTKYDWE